MIEEQKALSYIFTPAKRQRKWTKHLLRGDSLPRTVIGKMEEKRQ